MQMFAIGVILWEMIHRVVEGFYQRPYGEYANLQYDFQIIVKVSKEQVRPTIPRNAPEGIKSILVNNRLVQCRHEKLPK